MRPVCVPCGRSMDIARVGIIVQFNAIATKGAYEQWHADVHRCGSCGAQVVSRFAENPSWNHYDHTVPSKSDVIVDEIRGLIHGLIHGGSMSAIPRIPQLVQDGLARYIVDRTPTGGFLRAVLENDLCEACVRADLESRAALAEIVLWLYYNAPSECWGSPERVDAWLART